MSGVPAESRRDGLTRSASPADARPSGRGIFAATRHAPVAVRCAVMLLAWSVWPAAAQSPLNVAIPTTPGQAQRVTARLHPESVRLLGERNKYFPGFALSAWVEAGGRVIDVAPVAPDGQFEFVVPSAVTSFGTTTKANTPGNSATGVRGATATVARGSDMSGARGESTAGAGSAPVNDGRRGSVTVVVTPSIGRTPKHEPLPWSCELIGVEPLEGDVSRFTIDVGHPNDMVWLERGFSYQEGATHRGDSWATDINFRWTDLGFCVRVPILTRNRHRFTFRGHVPVGFEVYADGGLLARFEKPNASGVYAFTDFEVEKGSEAASAEAVGHPGTGEEGTISTAERGRARGTGDGLAITLRVESLSPFPPPNLDLRTLFWALDRIEVESIGSARGSEMWIPTASLLETAFRAALHSGLETGGRVPIDVRGAHRTAGGYKSEVQLKQEALLAVTCGGVVCSGPAEGAAQSTGSLLELVDQTAARASAAFGAGRIAADVGIYVSRSQWEAYQARPATSYGVLAPAFGAYAALHDARLPCIVISDERLAALSGALDSTPEMNERRAPPTIVGSSGAVGEEAVGAGVRCIIVPSATGVSGAAWRGLRRFVEKGGAVIAPAGLSLPRAEENGDAAAIFGAAVREYHRSHFQFRMGEEWVKLHNADWQAMLIVSTAKPMFPLVTNASRPATGSESPAVAVNGLGRGHGVLVCFDLFEQYIRYGDPSYRRLLARIVNEVSPGRVVEVEGTSLALPALREAEDHLVVSVVNVSRGQFDHGGLMNGARTAMFAEEIPDPEGMTLRVRCPQRIVELRELEIGDERASPAEWKWESGVMTIRVSDLRLCRGWRIGFGER